MDQLLSQLKNVDQLQAAILLGTILLGSIVFLFSRTVKADVAPKSHGRKKSWAEVTATPKEAVVPQAAAKAKPQAPQPSAAVLQPKKAVTTSAKLDAVPSKPAPKTTTAAAAAPVKAAPAPAKAAPAPSKAVPAPTKAAAPATATADPASAFALTGEDDGGWQQVKTKKSKAMADAVAASLEAQ